MIFYILYVTKLDENLLSIGQLLWHNYSLQFENPDRIFYSKGKIFVLVKRINNKSFLLSLNYEREINFMTREKKLFMFMTKKARTLKLQQSYITF